MGAFLAVQGVIAAICFTFWFIWHKEEVIEILLFQNNMYGCLDIAVGIFFWFWIACIGYSVYYFS